ncbi:MAG: UDP-N-acetylglucosamine 2-epimerase (hydrolyzing) [Planctomycetes bacterium]|nr:UDP-N-acetylglucosamine 2-epimerase (hydrolyzing) [Planctomycetota bacterium]
MLKVERKPRKICVVVTARASYSRIRTALAAIREHPDLQLQLVIGSSAVLDRYGNAAHCIEADGFAIDARIYNIVEGETLATSAKSTGLALVELSTVFSHLQPDVVVSIADRFETLATAVAAAYMNIPLAHIQGGEITGSIDEKVRHAVTKLADLHLVASQPAAERVVRMGEARNRVYVTGCPSIDLAEEIRQDSALNFDPLARYGGVGAAVDLSQGYLVVLQHPVTTECDEALAQITETLYAVKDVDLPILWFWPNVDAGSDATSKGIRRFRELENPANFHFFKHMDSKDFLRLLSNSRGIVGNSSVAIRECSYLGVPAVNIGTRQNGRDRGRNVIDVPHERQAIRAAVESLVTRGRAPRDTLYGEGNAGRRIADVLAAAPLDIHKRLEFEDVIHVGSELQHQKRRAA